MSADTAAYDRLFSKEAAFTTATITTLSTSEISTPLIISPTANIAITVTGTCTVNAALFTTNGVYLDQASAPNEIFTGSTVGDKLIYCTTEDMYIGPTAVSTNLFLRGTGVAIGANFYPQSTGTNGHVLTQSAPGTLVLAAPSNVFSSVVTSQIVFPGQTVSPTANSIGIKAAAFIELESPTIVQDNTYLSGGTGTSGGNGFIGITVPIGASSIRAETGMYFGSSGAGVSIISSLGGGVFANYNRIDVKGYGQYFGTATMQDFLDSYKPPTATGVQGASLTYDVVTGRFTNSATYSVLVTISYSVRATGGTSSGLRSWIRRNDSTAAGSSFGFSDVAPNDFATGTATVILAPTDFFRVIVEQGGAPTVTTYDAYSSITYILTSGV